MKWILVPFLFVTCSCAQQTSKPAANPNAQATQPSTVPLSDLEQTKLDNLRLNFAVINQRYQMESQRLQQMTLQYEADILKTHPGFKFHFDYPSMNWVPNPPVKDPKKK